MALTTFGLAYGIKTSPGNHDNSASVCVMFVLRLKMIIVHSVFSPKMLVKKYLPVFTLKEQ